MKIPNQVVILGRKFSIRNNLDEDTMKRLVNDGTCPMGALNYSQRVILIREHKNKEEQFVTYYHECLHAMQYIVGLNQITHGDMAEIWCESGANAIYDIIKSVKR